MHAYHESSVSLVGGNMKLGAWGPGGGCYLFHCRFSEHRYRFSHYCVILWLAGILGGVFLASYIYYVLLNFFLAI